MQATEQNELFFKASTLHTQFAISGDCGWCIYIARKPFLTKSIYIVYTCRAGYRMSLRIAREGDGRSTRHWSCATLQDGLEHLLSEAAQIEQEEQLLLQALEDGLKINNLSKYEICTWK